MRNRTGRRDYGADDGFTLVELIVAVLIIGVITVPLGNVVLGHLRNADATTARLIESHDVQIASAYWAQDAASIGTRSTTSPYPLSQSIETGVAYNSGLYPCGPAGTPNAIARLAWDNFSGAGAATVVRVAYVVEQTTELHRLRCEGPAATPLNFTVVSDVILAHDLDPSAPPTVACLGTSGVNCAAAPAVPTKVTLHLILKDPNNHDAAYDVALTGQRRQSS
jgi:prepilin-type N-terminal cleavage/methylation domain-containing protein